MEPNLIYCSSCGASNTAGARFCFKCGAPIQAAESPVPASRPSDFISLSCPNCGGKLEITPDMERFSCKYCGNEQLVRRTGGLVSLAPVVEGLKRVETKFDQVLIGSDRAAAEQTILRLKGEISQAEKEIAAWNDIIRAQSYSFAMPITFIIFGIGVILFSRRPFLGSFSAFLGSFNFWTQLFVDPSSASWEGSAVFPSGGIWLPMLGIVGIFAIFGGIKTLMDKTSKKGKQRLQYAKSNLAQWQAYLQQHEQQLADLHRYTAER